MGTFGHNWRKIQEDEKQKIKQTAIELTADLDWLRPTVPGDQESCSRTWPLEAFFDEDDGYWIFVDVYRVCKDCGALLISDYGGDFIAAIGPECDLTTQ